MSVLRTRRDRISREKSDPERATTQVNFYRSSNNELQSSAHGTDMGHLIQNFERNSASSREGTGNYRRVHIDESSLKNKRKPETAK